MKITKAMYAYGDLLWNLFDRDKVDGQHSNGCEQHFL